MFVPKHFSNDQFTIELDENTGCSVSATVRVQPSLVSKLNKDAIKKVKKDISLPGFRKGKAPDELIVSNYEANVKRQLHQLILDAGYRALTTVGDRSPLSPQAVKTASVEKMDCDEGGVVIFSYEAFPVIPQIDLTSIVLPESPSQVEVSDKDFEEGLQNIAYIFATKTPVTRPSIEGDFVSLSLHVSDSNNPSMAPIPVFENKYFKLSEEDMTDAFKTKFLGVSAGHKVVENIQSSDIQALLRGNILTFSVNAVIEISIPELDDEKARQLQAESLDDLKAKLRLRLEKQAQEKQELTRFSQAEDALANSVQFEVPATMLQERVSILNREKLLNARLIQYCSDEELESKKADLLQEAEKDAEKGIKLLFLTRKIFADEELSISREEIQSMVDTCARERFGIQPPQNISNEELQSIVTTARERLTYKKAIEAVLSKIQKPQEPSLI